MKVWMVLETLYHQDDVVTLFDDYLEARKFVKNYIDYDKKYYAYCARDRSERYLNMDKDEWQNSNGKIEILSSIVWSKADESPLFRNDEN